MKRVIIFSLLLVACLTLLIGCSKTSKLRYDANFSIGVIETTEQDNKSVLTLYNSNMEKTGALEYDLGSMGTFFDPPKIFNEYMYVIPKGIGNQKELTCLLEVNLETGTSKQYDMNLSANSFDVTDQYIYGVDTVNYTSVIARLNRTTNEIKTLEVPNVYIERILIGNEILFAFSIEKSSKGIVTSNLYEIDSETLLIIKKHSTTSYGVSCHGAVYSNGKLFFTHATKSGGAREEQPANGLVIFDPDSDSFETVGLGAVYPAQVVAQNDSLFIAHCNLVTGEGKNISVYNIKNEESELISLEHNVSQIQVQNNVLYATDGEMLYQYRLDGTKIILEKKVDARTVKNSKNHYYIGSLFHNR